MLKRQYDNGAISAIQVGGSVQGWMTYAEWGNAYRLRKNLMKEIEILSKEDNCVPKAPPQHTKSKFNP